MLQKKAFYCKIILRIGDYVRKKVIYKILVGLIIILIIMLIDTNVIFAKINTNVEIGNKLQNEAKPIGDRVTGALKVVGTFVAVAMTMIVGIKYMISGVEEKAEYKKTAIAYLIGAVLIFATVELIAFINTIINSI